jgi:putative hydrolase of the HAD superfamily
MERHLFFDLDRTLWDFEKNSEKALKFLFDETQSIHQLPSFYKFKQTYKDINAKLWKKYGKGEISKEELRNTRFNATFIKFGINNTELNDYFNREYLTISPLQTAIFPNTIETLNVLQKEGYMMHIITNGFKEVQLTKLKNCGLYDYFNSIVSSEEVGFNKPDIRIFKYAMLLANALPQHSVMIGDDRDVWYPL